MDIIENNGNFYKSFIDDNSLYIISKINVNEDKSKLPYFSEYIYKDNIVYDIRENKFDLSNIFYFPDINDSYYTLISYINIYSINNSLQNGVYLGMGDNIAINNDIIYVVTSNKDNNNIYQFKATSNDIEYINRKFVKGSFKNLKIDKETQFLDLFLENQTIHFDNDLNIR